VVLDDLLTQPRRFPHSLKICQERFDEYAYAAKAIYEKAVAENRDFTAAEDREFKRQADNAFAWKRERDLAREYEAAIRASSRVAPNGKLDPLFER
jgi:hypothetical protein